MDSARSAALQGRHFIRGNEAKQLAELKAAGMQVEDKPDLAAFRKATAPVLNAVSGDTRKLLEQIEQTVK
jgi:TRAP-type transport system periplasmic protein